MTTLAVLLTALATGMAVSAARGRPLVLPRRPGHRSTAAHGLWLQQAGVDLTPAQFWGASAFLGLVAATLLALLTGAPAVAVVPAVAVALLPYAYFSRLRGQRLRALQEAWPDGLRDLLASISTGMSLHQAIETLARSGPPPLQQAFRRYPSLARMLGVRAALEIVKEELADPTSDRVIEVLVLAHDKGSHVVADILRDLADATTADVRTLEQLATEGLEQKINARAVFFLPWAVLLLLTAREGVFRDFYRSGAGVTVVLAGACLSLVGMAVVARLGRQPVEQRVLSSQDLETTGSEHR